MRFLEALLQFLNTQMTQPQPYGWFHIVWLLITAAATVLAWKYGRKATGTQVRRIVLITAIVVTVLEIYKQINFTFQLDGGSITADFQWYAFPFQFCSTPMYVGLLAGLTRKGKLHHLLCAYLATYAIFAGAAVMFYPVTVFTPTVGINIQTMVCHGSMIPVGVLLYSSGYVKAEHRTIVRASCVFLAAVLIAVISNEIAYYTGLLETDVFNMFFISRHCDPSLPVYSLVQQVLPYPLCLIVYVLGFTAAGYIMLLIPMGMQHLQSSYFSLAPAKTLT